MAAAQRRVGGHDDGASADSAIAKSAGTVRCGDRSIALLSIHVAVFLFALTACIGKLVSYGSLFLVWHRTVIAFFGFLCVPQVWRDIASIPFRQAVLFSAIGVVQCMHWVTFYRSVQMGDSVSIPLTCLGTMAMFASLLEPCVLGAPFSLRDLLISLMVVCGVLQVYYSLPEKPPANNAEVDYQSAIIYGMASPFFTALASVLNKANIGHGSALAIATIEIGAAALFITILVTLMYGDEIVWYPTLDVSTMGWDTVRSGSFDLVWVVLMAILGTNMCLFLGNKALSQLSAFSVNLIGILEPIYGIILGAVMFHENRDLSVDFYYGAGIILLSLFANTIFTGIGQPSGTLAPSKIVINPLLEDTSTHLDVPASHSAAVGGRYISNLRKPKKMSPHAVGAVVGSHLRRASRNYDDDLEDEEARFY